MGQGEDGSAAESRLTDLTLAMNREVDTEALAGMRDRFIEAVRKLKPEVKRDNKSEVKPFSEAELVEIANFFFGEVMGPASLARLRSLISFYNQETEHGLDVGVSARAASLAGEEETPHPLREFFMSFSKAEAAQVSKTSVFGQINQTVLGLELHRHYNELRSLARTGDPALLAFLRAQGQRTRKGVGWQSCVINYLAASLETTPTILQNTCQTAQGVAGLVEQFGPGIIVLLPAGASHKYAASLLPRMRARLTAAG
jgi:hypothetical protein